MSCSIHVVKPTSAAASWKPQRGWHRDSPFAHKPVLSNLDAKLDARLAIALCLLRAGMNQQMGLEYGADLQPSVKLGRPQSFVRSLLTVQRGS